MLIKSEADLQEDSMSGDIMAEEDVFMAYPRLLDTDQSEKKMGMGKFADTLSKRSLSTSTPCVRRSFSAATVEDDSGYAESLTESLCSSANSTGYMYDDLYAQSGSLSDSKNLASLRAPPKINIELYSEALHVQPDWDFVESDDVSQLSSQSLRYSNNPAARLSPVKENSMIENDGDDSMEADSALNGSSLAERFAEVLKRFSPQEPDRLIGRKMLLEKVDILSELDSRNLNFSCISVILDYLEPEDLCRMCQVSQEWKSICCRDQKANERKKHFICQQRQSVASDKENHAYKKSPKKSRGLTQSVGSCPLKSMQALGSRRRTIDANTLPSSVTRTTEKSLLYEQAAKSLLNDEYLCPCRKCSHPARVNKTQERAKCFNNLCAFDFCVKCLSEFHGSMPCVPVAIKKSKTDVVGSKRSKKNLRRLTLGR